MAKKTCAHVFIIEKKIHVLDLCSVPMQETILLHLVCNKCGLEGERRVCQEQLEFFEEQTARIQRRGRAV